MLIIVCGLPGSGKSFFAERLAARTGAILFSSDRIRIAMKASGQYAEEDKRAVYREMLRLSSMQLQSGHSVIVDATFYLQSLRDEFRQLAEDEHTPFALLHVKAEEDLVKQRLEKPRTESEADYKVYQKIKAVFEPVTMPCLVLESTDQNIDALLQQAETYLSKIL